jgi:hypothetical protein
VGGVIIAMHLSGRIHISGGGRSSSGSSSSRRSIVVDGTCDDDSSTTSSCSRRLKGASKRKGDAHCVICCGWRR